MKPRREHSLAHELTGRAATRATAAAFCGLLTAIAAFAIWRSAPLPTAPTGATLRINPNLATPAELALLPDVGPTIAARIVADRERRGPFQRFEQLDRVPGIGPVTLASLRPWIDLPGAADPAVQRP